MNEFKQKLTGLIAKSRKGSIFGIGMFMGVADLIPGVSGGTIAFIFGIYEELLYSIRMLTGSFFQYLFKGQLLKAIKIVPFGFLLPLGSGILISVFLFASGVEFLLTNSPMYVWAFFFGLVVSSVRLVVSRVVKWSRFEVVGFILSCVGAFFLVGFSPRVTPDSLLVFFISGVVAICAMILPGISGSFILVLLGKYEQLLEAVTEFRLKVLLVFAFGAVLGLAGFSRVLKWLFAKYHDLAVAVLAGFMLGSLRRIWPWQEDVGNKLFLRFPSLEFETLLVFAAILLGFILMEKLAKLGATRERTVDVASGEFVSGHKQSLQEERSRMDV